MRKIEEQMINAVNNCKSLSVSNTLVTVSNNEVKVYLHGNLIYTKENGVERFTLAGWNTNTTRSRLRALGVDVCQRKRKPVYKGSEISSYKWYNV